MERDSFVFYSSFLKAIRAIKKRDIQAELALAIIEYGITGETAECGEMVSMAMELIKPQLEANNQKYINGLKGGAPKGNQNAKKGKEQPKNNQKQPNENVNENVNVNEKEKKYIKKENQDFSSLWEEWENYMKEIHSFRHNDYSRQKSQEKLKELGKNDLAAMQKIVNNSIGNNYKDFYLKENKQEEKKETGRVARDGTRIMMF
jgi:hypothetical protein bacD2_23229|nr:MAG TPA: hypothetical protein [Caudoviricetes sp.]